MKLLAFIGILVRTQVLVLAEYSRRMSPIPHYLLEIETESTPRFLST